MLVDPVRWRVRNAVLSNSDHTLVMGILNVTPDSFSDGGQFVGVDDAIAAGLVMVADGADIVDVGGESTRPGASPVTADHELERVLPVIEGLAQAGVTVSVDTMHPPVAAAAVEAGAVIVNDVSGLRDPAMTEVCAAMGVGVVVMHMQGNPQTMQDDPRYADVVTEVRDHLLDQVAMAEDAGIEAESLCIDPGIGFGKTFSHNLELLAGLEAFADTGYPVLVGASRKGFLGTITDAAGRPTLPAERDAATAATTALGIAHGASVIRVHDVPSTLQAARTADAIVRAAPGSRMWSESWPG